MMPAAWAWARPSAIWAGVVEGLLRAEADLVAQDVAERPSRDELGHDEGLALGAPDLVDGEDVRVVQGGGGAGLLGESGEPLRAGGEPLGQELHRDVAQEVVVARAVDLPHAPRTQHLEELVAAESHADGWGHDASARGRGLFQEWPFRPRL